MRVESNTKRRKDGERMRHFVELNGLKGLRVAMVGWLVGGFITTQNFQLQNEMLC